MDRSITESLNKIRQLESGKVLTEAPAVANVAGTASDLANTGAAAAGLASKASKFSGLAKFVPGLGLVAGGADAIRRASAGDWAGAGLSAAGGVASLVPGIGTAAGLGIAGVQAARDYARTGSIAPDSDQLAAASAPAQTPASAATAPTAQPQAAPVAQAQPQPAAAPKLKTGADQKVAALQQKLVAKGAKIAVDGIMGPQTQAAMKQFPDVQLAGKINKIKGSYMSESDKMADLRARLTQIESHPLSEGPLDSLAKGVKGAYDWGKGAVAGFRGGAPATAAASGSLGKSASAGADAALAVKDKVAAAGNAVKTATSTVGDAAKKAGTATVNAVKNNPGKAAVAGMAAAGGAGYMAGKSGAAPAAKPAGGAAKPAATPAPAGGSDTVSGLSDAERAELDALAKELGAAPEAADLMKQYNALPKPAPAATPAGASAKPNTPPVAPADAGSVDAAKAAGAANPTPIGANPAPTNSELDAIKKNAGIATDNDW